MTPLVACCCTSCAAPLLDPDDNLAARMQGAAAFVSSLNLFQRVHAVDHGPEFACFGPFARALQICCLHINALLRHASGGYTGLNMGFERPVRRMVNTMHPFPCWSG